ncbi:MAG: phosphocholine cytidylyltransferase family protein [Lachnospiraceae bacterium]|nr:phosphocholine cytidylyltransferase family protein [Lachnospiraceae bacterium]
MTYIFLVAGKGSRLHPLTLATPKSLYKLDKNTTVLQRMIRIIEKCDTQAKFVVVGGFLFDNIKKELEDVSNIEYVFNPFYEVTNSIASLWFAKEYLNEDVVILNGDIVMEKKLICDVVCRSTSKPMVLIDSSVKNDGDYNVQVLGDRVLVMSKNLDKYFGEYAGVTKLDNESAHMLREEIEYMLSEGMYDQWYENALVQLIFDDAFKLFFEDIGAYKWTEVDSVSDMLLAKTIHNDING